jgi:hypothetical protein
MSRKTQTAQENPAIACNRRLNGTFQREILVGNDSWSDWISYPENPIAAGRD